MYLTNENKVNFYKKTLNIGDVIIMERGGNFEEFKINDISEKYIYYTDTQTNFSGILTNSDLVGAYIIN